MPMSYAQNLDTCTAELTIRGPLAWSDYLAVMGPMAQLAQRCGTIKVIEIVESFAGFDDGFEEDISAAQKAPPPSDGPDVMSRISHVAIVSDMGWFCPILSNSQSGTQYQLRNFTLEELPVARAWTASFRRAASKG